MRQYKVNLHSTLELLTGQENLCYNFGGIVQLPIIHIKGNNTHQFIKELIHQFIKELIQPGLQTRLDTIGDTTQIKRQTREKRADNKPKKRETTMPKEITEDPKEITKNPKEPQMPATIRI